MMAICSLLLRCWRFVYLGARIYLLGIASTMTGKSCTMFIVGINVITIVTQVWGEINNTLPMGTTHPSIPLGDLPITTTPLVDNSTTTLVDETTPLVENSTTTLVDETTPLVEKSTTTLVDETTPLVEKSTTTLVDETTPLVDNSTTTLVDETTPLVDNSTTTLVDETTPLVDNSTTTLVDETTPLVDNSTTTLVDETTQLVENSTTTLVDETTPLVENSTTTLVDETTPLVDNSTTTLIDETTPLVDNSTTTLVDETTPLVDNSTTTLVDKTTTLVDNSTTTLVDKTTPLVDNSTATLVDKTTPLVDNSTTTLVYETTPLVDNTTNPLVDKTINPLMGDNTFETLLGANTTVTPLANGSAENTATISFVDHTLAHTPVPTLFDNTNASPSADIVFTTPLGNNSNTSPLADYTTTIPQAYTTSVNQPPENENESTVTTASNSMLTTVTSPTTSTTTASIGTQTTTTTVTTPPNAATTIANGMSNQQTPETPLTDLLKTLITKQSSACGYESLCTLRKPAKPLKNLACCGTCSCHSDCLTDHNCCVDYAISKALGIGNVTFPFLSDLKFALNNITTRLRIEAHLEDMYLSLDGTADDVDTFLDNTTTANDELNGKDTLLDNSTKVTHEAKTMDVSDTVECLPRQMVHEHRRSSHGEYYEIVTGCKGSGFDSAKDCSEGNKEPAEFMDPIPVTSLSTGKPYRNRSVLECCGGTDSGPLEYWDMFVECREPIDYFPTYKHHPLVLLDRLQLHRFCNTVFEPSDTIKNTGAVPKTCKHVDITTCAKKHTSKRGMFLQNFCATEQHYVRLVDQTGPRVYNNIACYTCNSGGHVGNFKACGPDEDALKMRVNLRDVSRHRVSVKDLSEGGLLDVRAFPKLSVLKKECPPWKIYIPLLGECRRVYCPRGMFIVNRSCVPLYNHVTGASYSIIFNMTIISPVTRHFNETTFEREFVRFLRKDHFESILLIIERIRMRKLLVGHTYMVEMILTPSNETSVILRDVVEAVTSLYYTTVDIRVSRTDIVEIGISPGISTYFKSYKSYGDESDAIFGIRDVIKTTNPGHVFKYTIGIAESFVCFRIGIDIPRPEYLHQHTITLPVINETIPVENIDFRPNPNEMLVCAAQWMNQSREFHVNLESHVSSDVKGQLNNRTMTTVEDGTIKYSVLIVIVGAAGTFLFVVGRLTTQRVSACLARSRDAN